MTYPWPLPIRKQKDQQASALIRDRAPLLLLNPILATFFPRIQASYTPLSRCIKQANPADPPDSNWQTLTQRGQVGLLLCPGDPPRECCALTFSNSQLPCPLLHLLKHGFCHTFVI